MGSKTCPPETVDASPSLLLRVARKGMDFTVQEKKKEENVGFVPAPSGMGAGEPLRRLLPKEISFEVSEPMCRHLTEAQD